jgi:hypothetical protein
VHPKIQIEHRQVGPNVADLLLARALDFFHVVEVLFDGRSIGECFHNLHDAGIRIGAEESVPSMAGFAGVRPCVRCSGAVFLGFAPKLSVAEDLRCPVRHEFNLPVRTTTSSRVGMAAGNSFTTRPRQTPHQRAQRQGSAELIQNVTFRVSLTRRQVERDAPIMRLLFGRLWGTT